MVGNTASLGRPFRVHLHRKNIGQISAKFKKKKHESKLMLSRQKTMGGKAIIRDLNLFLNLR